MLNELARNHPVRRHVHREPGTLKERPPGEQRHAYLKAAGVSALVVRKEDFTISMMSGQGTDTADDLVPCIPMNVVTEVGDGHAANISLSALREQLQHVSAV